MDVIENLEQLLPIVHPFKLKEVKKDEESKEVHLYFEVEKGFGVPEGHTVNQYYGRTWEHINLFQYRCFFHCEVPIFEDLETGKTKAMEVGFSRPNSRFTLLYEEHVMELMGIYLSPTKVAKQLGLYPQRVASVYHYYTTGAYESHTVTACERVGVDETSTRKGHDYITVFVDMDSAKIVDIEDGKGADTIEKFFHSHPNPQVVKDISMDMSPAFGSGVERFFSWARATFDKWHVFKLQGKHLDGLYRKHKDKREFFPFIHENMAGVYGESDIDEAKARLAFTADFAESIFGGNSFSKSIRRHFDGIVEYIRSNLTNGILEGINSKIQTIKRVAKGFRYKENFKKMILFAFGIIKPKFATK